MFKVIYTACDPYYYMLLLTVTHTNTHTHTNIKTQIEAANTNQHSSIFFFLYGKLATKFSLHYTITHTHTASDTNTIKSNDINKSKEITKSKNTNCTIGGSDQLVYIGAPLKRSAQFVNSPSVF